MNGPLGSGTYRVEIAETGCGDERGNVRLDVTDQVRTIRWQRVLDKPSQAQVLLFTDAKCRSDLCGIRTVFDEMRIIRDNDIIWEGPISRRRTTRNQIQLIAVDLSWWLQRRFIPEGLLNGATMDVAEIARVIVTGTMNRLSNGEPMDPHLADLVRTRLVGLFGAPNVSGSSYRYAYEELSTWASTDLDWTMVKRAFLAGDPPVRDSAGDPVRFPTMTLDHITGTPQVEERGDLYATDVVTIGGDGKTVGIASVEQVLGVKVDACVRAERREVVEAVTDQTALQSIAESLVKLSYPPPVDISIGNSGLSPKAPICVDQMVPGAVGTIDVTGYCAERTRQESEITEVKGTVTEKGEKIDMSVTPVTTVAA